MDKAGFRKEGERFDAQFHDGKIKDRLEYAINNSITYTNGAWNEWRLYFRQSSISKPRGDDSPNPQLLLKTVVDWGFVFCLSNRMSNYRAKLPVCAFFLTANQSSK